MKILPLSLAVIIISIIAFNLPFFSSKEYPPLISVPDVDIAKYGGRWLEIGHLPHIWEADCYCTAANYALNSDGIVGVKNTCTWGSSNGKVIAVTGTATPVDPVNGTVTNGRLTVKFFGFVKAPYYIMKLDPNYQYVLVGSPSRKYFWILSRTPNMDENLYQELLQEAAQHGFDTSKFIKTYQGEDCNWDSGPYFSF